MSEPMFYLGTPEPSWLWRARHLPLFVSHRRLARRSATRRLPRATTAWALDSGGYSELDEFGEWRTTAREYIAAVARYDDEIGGMEWAAPQDWMCEGPMLAKTGLTAGEHRRRTVASVVELRAMWGDYSDDTCPIAPVLQADPDDLPGYLDCAALYAAAGIDLFAEPLVGIGSVCRQEDTDVIERTVAGIAAALPGVPLHGFGVKAGGLRRVGHLLASADSQAWSMGGRYRDVRTPWCEHAGACSWCPYAALEWRLEVRELAGLPRDCARFPEHGEPAYWPLPLGERLALAA